MTPAINDAKRANIDYKIHQYAHDAKAASYGLEAAEKLGLKQQQVFKTLVICIDSTSLAVAIVPVSSTLNLKLMAKACHAKKAKMADAQEVERSSGYVIGGVSPLGQKKKLKTVIDSSAFDYPSIYVSAGKRGLEIELSAKDLMNLTQAIKANIHR